MEEDISRTVLVAEANTDASDSIPQNPLQNERVPFTYNPPDNGHTKDATPFVNMNTENEVGACHTKEPIAAQLYDEANTITVHIGPSAAGSTAVYPRQPRGGNLFNETERTIETKLKKKGV